VVINAINWTNYGMTTTFDWSIYCQRCFQLVQKLARWPDFSTGLFRTWQHCGGGGSLTFALRTREAPRTCTFVCVRCLHARCAM